MHREPLDTTYVALLRGINVGGNNLMKMADVKGCLEQSGFERVATFIQSGNVVFCASDSDSPGIVRRIESALSKRFGCDAKVVVLSYQQLKYAVDHAPRGFGKSPDRFRYDVIFLRPPVRPGDAVAQVPIKEGVDRAHAGKDVLYFSRLIARETQSKLSKLASLPLYKELTIRNWRTTTRLLDLMERGTTALPKP